MTKQRLSNFELLRIICILLILTMHSMAQVDSTDLSPANVYLSHVVSSVGNIGVSCFILISGYFGVKFKLHRFLQLVLLTTFYTVLVHLFQNGFVFDRSLIKALLVIPLYDNWFITCYLLLMLFAPYLNKFVMDLTKLQYTKLLAVSVVFFCILPTALNTPWYTVLFGGGKCFTYVIFLYMMGRFLRLHADINIKRSKVLLVLSLFQTLILVGNIGMEHLLHKSCRVLALDCSPFILGSAICAFYMFKTLCFHSKSINNISSSVLAVFLLDGLRQWMNNYIHIENYATSHGLIIALLTLVFSTFAFSVIMDKVRILLLVKFENRLLDYSSNLILRLKKYTLRKIENKYDDSFND